MGLHQQDVTQDQLIQQLKVLPCDRLLHPISTYTTPERVCQRNPLPSQHNHHPNLHPPALPPPVRHPQKLPQHSPPHPLSRNRLVSLDCPPRRLPLHPHLAVLVANPKFHPMLQHPQLLNRHQHPQRHLRLLDPPPPPPHDLDPQSNQRPQSRAQRHLHARCLHLRREHCSRLHCCDLQYQRHHMVIYRADDLVECRDLRRHHLRLSADSKTASAYRDK